MKINKKLFDFVGYKGFFSPLGSNTNTSLPEKHDELLEDVLDCSSSEEFAEQHADEFDSVEDAEEFWENNSF